jgi:hypothetical protein
MCLHHAQEKKIGMQETKEIKYEVGSHAYFSPKLAWRMLFHMNFKGIDRIQSFILKVLIEKLSIKTKSYKLPLFFLLFGRRPNKEILSSSLGSNAVQRGWQGGAQGGGMLASCLR